MSDGSIDETFEPSDGGESPLRVYGPRVLVTLFVAGVVAFGLGVVPSLLAAPAPSPSPTNVTDLNTSEYDTDDLAVTAIPARGDVTVNATGSGTVVIDQSHANDFDREKLQPLREALVQAGYRVVLHGTGDLGTALENATAFVVIDPGAEFDEEDTDAVRNFTDTGGRVLVLAEPTVVRVQTSFTGAQVVRIRSYVDQIGSEYNLSFRKSYVYNQEHNDGNYKNPLASPVGPAAEGAGQDVALYTAGRVVSLRGGQPVLRLREGSRTSGIDRTGRFTVGVRKGNLIAVGDSSFLDTGRYNVADNEAFLGFLVEFLLSGEREKETPTPTATPTPTSTPTATPTPTSTPTATPTSTPTATPTPTPNGTATSTPTGNSTATSTPG